MTKLNQIIAIEKGAKTAAAQTVTRAAKLAQAAGAFDGIARTYRPKDDDGDHLPAETKRVEATVQDLLQAVRAALVRQINVTATKDDTNTVAKAPVVVDGVQIIDEVPATHLLYLEKQLNELHALIARLPRLDPGETWDWDAGVRAWASEPVETHRTRKVPRAQVLYEATDKHPAQVRVYDEDIVVGYWKTVKFSGALSASEADAMLDRIVRLRDAVKQAREEANGVEVIDRSDVGENVLGYILGSG